MKLPVLGAIAALTLSFATATMAADSDTQETVSGAADSTVMTQTQKDGSTVKQVTKQNQADENKRGRPADKTSSATN